LFYARQDPTKNSSAKMLKGGSFMDLKMWKSDTVTIKRRKNNGKRKGGFYFFSKELSLHQENNDVIIMLNM
jgi:hypothetical protein